MKAFISYSHRDSEMLELLHKHLSQLRRDNIINTWTDHEIQAGQSFNQVISSALNDSDIFLALLSPDYIASNYCYEKEFEKAMEMQSQGNIIIIPVILEPCDWVNTPFKDFKALPKDGKAISLWENKNTALLDVVQNIRKLIASSDSTYLSGTDIKPSPIPASRNYRVQKDFDSIQKIEFAETSFHEIKEFLKRFLEEVAQLDNIKSRVQTNTEKLFECLLVNRNKIATGSLLKVLIGEQASFSFTRSNDKGINYSIESKTKPTSRSFTMAFDEYHLYWSEGSYYSGSRDKKELTSKDIADIIWNEWLESVGIL